MHGAFTACCSGRSRLGAPTPALRGSTSPPSARRLRCPPLTIKPRCATTLFSSLQVVAMCTRSATAAGLRALRSHLERFNGPEMGRRPLRSDRHLLGGSSPFHFPAP